MKSIDVTRVIFCGQLALQEENMRRMITGLCYELGELPDEAWIANKVFPPACFPTDLVVMTEHEPFAGGNVGFVLQHAGGVIWVSLDSSGSTFTLQRWGMHDQLIGNGMVWDGKRRFEEGTFKVKQAA